MAKSVYAVDLKSTSSDCGFESRWRHFFKPPEMAVFLLFPTVLTDNPSDIKAFGLSHKSFQTHLRSFQTQKTGDETGGFLMVLGMKREDFDSFEPGESE